MKVFALEITDMLVKRMCTSSKVNRSWLLVQEVARMGNVTDTEAML